MKLGIHGQLICQFMPITCQRQPRIAQCAGDPYIVAGLRRIPAQSLPRRGFAEYRDADIQRTLGSIATDQLAMMLIGQR